MDRVRSWSGGGPAGLEGRPDRLRAVRTRSAGRTPKARRSRPLGRLGWGVLGVVVALLFVLGLSARVQASHTSPSNADSLLSLTAPAAANAFGTNFMLGHRFTPDLNGTVTILRVYVGTTANRPQRVYLYSGCSTTGTLLTSATVNGSAPVGWLDVVLGSGSDSGAPQAVTAGSCYVVSAYWAGSANVGSSLSTPKTYGTDSVDGYLVYNSSVQSTGGSGATYPGTVSGGSTWGVDVVVQMSLPTPTPTPSPTPTPLSNPTFVQLGAPGYNDNLPSYIEAIVMGDPHWETNITALTSQRTHQYVAAYHELTGQPRERYAGVQMGEQSGEVICTGGPTPSETLPAPNRVWTNAFLRFQIIGQYAPLDENGQVPGGCGGQNGYLQISSIEPTNTWWYDPYLQRCYGPNQTQKGANWQCSSWYTSGSAQPTATLPAFATITPFATVQATVTPVPPIEAMPTYAPPVPTQATTDPGVGQGLNDVAEEIRLLPGRWLELLRRGLIGDTQKLSEEMQMTNQVWLQKVAGLEPAQQQIRDFSAAWTDGNCDDFQGVSFTWNRPNAETVAVTVIPTGWRRPFCDWRDEMNQFILFSSSCASAVAAIRVLLYIGR